MSINFTSDIDGATSGSDITKITVGGKTINLTEVSSGSSGGVASGSFTPEAQAASYVIETGIDFNHIFVGKKTPTIGYGYRTMCGIFADIANNFIYEICTNAAGTSFSGGIFVWESNPVDCKKEGTVLNFSINTASYGYLCPEEYVWYAW